ncbi:hypothetical protein [Croceibacterium ferulae]|uniref:hypothetical protein n=1 Tax=Croceibacterium ferulae TaxID=1854641 RepID=UPI001F4ED59C|nr:hypothetical protein [Croceibacterium ferulae]
MRYVAASESLKGFGTLTQQGHERTTGSEAANDGGCPKSGRALGHDTIVAHERTTLQPVDQQAFFTVFDIPQALTDHQQVMRPETAKPSFIRPGDSDKYDRAPCLCGIDQVDSSR